MAVENPNLVKTFVSPWSGRARIVVSILLLTHISAQVLATWNAAPPPNPLMHQAAIPLNPYIAAAKLDQGYRFFAPDPPRVSHLLKFSIVDAQGKPVALTAFNLDPTTGVLPPPELRVGPISPSARLLYHRYFMLTEQVAQFDPLDNPPERYAESKANYAAVMSSYARELLRRFGGQKITLDYQVHHVLTLGEAHRIASEDRELDLAAPASYESHPWRIEYSYKDGLKFIDRATGLEVVDPVLAPGQGRGP